jgi:hypothetical protein
MCVDPFGYILKSLCKALLCKEYSTYRLLLNAVGLNNRPICTIVCFGQSQDETIDVLLNAVSLNNRPICTIVSFGQRRDELTFSCFNLNISHLDFEDFHILVHRV